LADSRGRRKGSRIPGDLAAQNARNLKTSLKITGNIDFHKKQNCISGALTPKLCFPREVSPANWYIKLLPLLLVRITYAAAAAYAYHPLTL